MDYSRFFHRPPGNAGASSPKHEFGLFKTAVEIFEKNISRSNGLLPSIEIRLPHRIPIIACADSRLYSCGYAEESGGFVVLVSRHHVIRYSHCAPENDFFIMKGIGQGERVGIVEYNQQLQVSILRMDVGSLRRFNFRSDVDYELPLKDPLDPIGLMKEGKIGLPVDPELLVRMSGK